jgi:outer membrane lipoprotein-sorting protein
MNRLRLTAGVAGFAVIAALGGVGLASAQVAPAARMAQAPTAELTGAARTTALTQASAALNQFRLAQGRFTQVAPDGARTQGGFWLSRPGRVRFEYDSPSPLLIVADGSTVAIQDRRMRTTDRIPLNTTPLQFILRAQTNLEQDARVTRVVRTGGTTQISLRDRTGRTDGELTLVFTGEGAAMALNSWVVRDGAGGQTRVTLSNVTRPSRIDPRQFILREADPTRAGRR